MTEPGPPSGPPPAGLFELSAVNVDASPGFESWLAEERVGLAFTTGTRLFLVGRTAGGLSIVERTFEGAGGLAALGAQTLYLATRWQIWRLENALAPGQLDASGHDRLFLAQSAHTTGFLAVHDIGVDGAGDPVFPSAQFNCLGVPSRRWNFTATWRPPFVSGLVAEPRCLLTGVAI